MAMVADEVSNLLFKITARIEKSVSVWSGSSTRPNAYEYRRNDPDNDTKVSVIFWHCHDTK